MTVREFDRRRYTFTDGTSRIPTVTDRFRFLKLRFQRAWDGFRR